MFVLSMKTTRPRLVAYGVVLGLLLVVMFAAGRRDRARVQTVAAGGGDAARVSYLQQQGYEVEPQWVDVREVTVPDSETIPAAYRGKRIKCFTYATAGGETVCLYEYDGRIIGTDKGSGHGTIG